MNDDMTTWQCPRCPVTFEAFVDDDEGDASDGMSKQEAYNQLDDHMASVHGMDDEQIRRALLEQTAAEEEPGGVGSIPVEERQQFVDHMMEDEA